MATSERDSAKAPKKKLGGDGADAGDPVQKYLILLKDYQNYAFGVLFVALALGVLFVLFNTRSQQHEDQAWIDLGHEHNPSVEKLAQLEAKYEGTSAEAFIALQHASKLYERGTEEDLLAAKKVLTRTIDVSRGNEIVVELARKELAGIDRELADKSLWSSIKGSTAQVGSGTPPK